MDRTLRRYWMQEDESALAEDTKQTLEELRKHVAKRTHFIMSNALIKIVARAEAGEVEACDWLERRGFIQWPKADGGKIET